MPDQTIDIEALQADAQQRLEDLEGRRQRLALDMLGDPALEQDLAAVEAEIAGVEVNIYRLQVAAVEHGRREVLRLEEEEYERRRGLLVAAGEQAATALTAARAVDKAAAAYVDKISAYVVACQDTERSLREAGESLAADVARPQTHQIEHALAGALREREGDHGIRVLGRIGYVPYDHARPLAEQRQAVLESVGLGILIERFDAEREAATRDDAGAVA